LLVLLQRAPLSAAPLITNISPLSGAPGKAVDITGTGFTGLQEIRFFSANFFAPSISASAPFSGLTDTSVHTSVPSGVGSAWTLAMFGPTGGTLEIPADFVEITSTITTLAGTTFLVRSGGDLTLTGGSRIVFVESGGSLHSQGGEQIIFMQQGASLLMDGGLSEIYHEQGVTITDGGGGNTFTVVSELTPSFVPIPEPSTLALAGLGLLGIVALRWRRKRQAIL
jgi:hypothetical protein